MNGYGKLRAVRRLVPALVIAGASLWNTACEPVDGVVLVIGDSVSWQVEHSDGDALDSANWLVAPGVTAGDPFIRDGVANYVNDPARSPEVAIYALGLNDAALRSSAFPQGDGWSSRDFDNMVRVLDTLDPATCEVVVLPGIGPGIQGPPRVELEKARVAMYLLARSRGATVADWQPVVDADPSLLASDSVHLRDDPAGVERSNPAAARVRRQLYLDGVAQCG